METAFRHLLACLRLWHNHFFWCWCKPSLMTPWLRKIHDSITFRVCFVCVKLLPSILSTDSEVLNCEDVTQVWTKNLRKTHFYVHHSVDLWPPSPPPPPVCICSPVVQPAPLSAGNTKSSYKDTFRKERVILWLQPATNPVCSGSSTETEQIRKISVHIFLDSKGCYLENEWL